MADTANNKQFSVMVNKDGVINYPSNFIEANTLITETDLRNFATHDDLDNKQDVLSGVYEFNEGDSIEITNTNISLGGDATGITITQTEGMITMSSPNGVDGTLIASTIGTSETSAKLPTEGAIVKALKNVSGSAPSNMVTTDTEQTITGNKTFTNISLPETLPVYDLVQTTKFDEGDLTTSAIHLGANETMINAKNEGLYFNCSNVSFHDATGEGFSPGNALMAIKGYEQEVEFYVPQRLRVQCFGRVYNQNTFKWKEVSAKYTYIIQDTNGNISFAISDTLPRDINFYISTSADTSIDGGLTSANSYITLSITHDKQEDEEQFDFSQTNLASTLDKQIKLLVNRSITMPSSSNITTEYLNVTDTTDSTESINYTIPVSYDSGNITIGGQQLDLSSIPTTVSKVYGKFEIYRNGEKFGESTRFAITR